MECATSNGSVWPYSSSGSVSASATSQIGSSLGSYSLGQGSSLASMTPAPFSSASQYPRMPSGHGYTFAAPASRHGYAPAYGLGYGDDPTDAYSQQSPPYMLPSQDTIGMSSAYGSQDALRTWNPITQSSKNPHGGLFLDQESPPSYGLSQLPYLSSSMSRHPVVTADASSFFPAMTSLVSSLPMAGSTGDRTLPNPTAGRAHMQQANINTISHGSTGDAVPLTSQGLNYKSGVPWGPESVTSGGSQSSTSTLSGTSTLMDTSSMRPSTSNAQESAFGYIPLSGSPPAELAAPSILYNTPSLLSSVTNPSNHANSAASSFHRTSSKEPFLQSHNSSSDLYSYSNENSSKRGSFGEAGPSDSTLANGQQYTRLRQPQSQHAASPDAL
ncbi:MAG: hypothetical protein M1830_009690, partial [Pleopsidium flavum]